ncbi:MAG: ABC transporter permease [Planctomycetota bacterium]
MTLYSIVLKNMRQRALASVLTIVSIALGVALVSAILLVNTEAQRNFYSSSTGWDLIVGPKGSPLELVLNAVFNLTTASNTIPYSVYEDLLHDKRVDFAVPFCSGDSYRNFRIVATNPAFFERYEYELPTKRYYRGEMVPIPGKKLELADDGAWWKDVLGEAIVGSFVARSTGLKVGDQFLITHGLNVEEEMREQHTHKDLPFTVTGVLKPTGSPVDKVIYVSLDTWFHLAGHLNIPKSVEAHEEHEHEHEAEHPAAEAAHDEHAEHEHAPVEKRFYQLTSIGVRLVETADPLQLLWEYRDQSTIAQAVLPLQEITLFFQNVLGWVSALFVSIASMVIVVSSLGVMVWIYNSMNERRRDIAIMRSLGAGRWTIFGTILAESGTLCAAGALVGIPLAHLCVQLAGNYIRMTSGAIVDAWRFSPYEPYLLLGTVLLGLVVGVIPAVKAYDTDVAENLRPLA